MGRKKSPCEKCPLFARKPDHFIPGRGDPSSGRMILGRDPGATDDVEKRVFAGADGQLLDEALVERGPCYITNAVKCYQGIKGNPPPPPKAIQMCREAYLDAEIAAMPPNSRILALGGDATHSLLRDSRAVKKLLGRPYSIGPPGTFAMTTYHPAAYLHSGDQRQLRELEMGLMWLFREKPPHPLQEYVVLTNEASIRKAASLCGDDYTIDIETSWGPKLGSPDFHIVMAGFKPVGKDPAYLAVLNHDAFPSLSPKVMVPLLSLKGATAIGQNITFDLSSLAYDGAPIPQNVFDTEVALKHHDNTYYTYSLKPWAVYMGFPPYWIAPHILMQGLGTERTPIDILAQYCATDLQVTEYLYHQLVKSNRFKENSAAFELEMEILPEVAQMVANGVTIDRGYLEKQAAKTVKLVAQKEREVRRLAKLPDDFNFGSWQQIASLLYDDLGLPSDKVRGRKTDEEALIRLNHPVAKALLERRMLAKLHNTFMEPFLEKSDHQTGMIYGPCDVRGTESGRFRRRNPPLQTIPKTLREMIISRYEC